jgi:hypothetical protein
VWPTSSEYKKGIRDFNIQPRGVKVIRTLRLQEHGWLQEHLPGTAIKQTSKYTFLKVSGRKHFTGTGKESGTSGTTLHPAGMQ